jgi:hypothetical protein
MRIDITERISVIERQKFNDVIIVVVQDVPSFIHLTASHSKFLCSGVNLVSISHLRDGQDTSVHSAFKIHFFNCSLSVLLAEW